jgi:hypothetical protein
MGKEYYFYCCIRQLVNETYGNIAVNMNNGTNICINTNKQKRQTEMVYCFRITDNIITNGLIDYNLTREEKEDV